MLYYLKKSLSSGIFYLFHELHHLGLKWKQSDFPVLFPYRMSDILDSIAMVCLKVDEMIVRRRQLWLLLY